MKAEILNAFAAAGTITKQIENNKDHWGWAHNAENLGKLQTAQARVNVDLGEFGQAFLISEAKDVKDQYGEPHLLVQLEKFNELQETADEFAKQIKAMTIMHKAYKASL